MCDPENLNVVNEELKNIGQLLLRAPVRLQQGDAFRLLSDAVERLKMSGKNVAPAFVFVHPMVSRSGPACLADLMVAGRGTLHQHHPRGSNMAVQQRPSRVRALHTLDTIFGGEEWRTEIMVLYVNERMNQAVRLLARKVGAKWWTYVRMVMPR